MNDFEKINITKENDKKIRLIVRLASELAVTSNYEPTQLKERIVVLEGRLARAREQGEYWRSKYVELRDASTPVPVEATELADKQRAEIEAYETHELIKEIESWPT